MNRGASTNLVSTPAGEVMAEIDECRGPVSRNLIQEVAVALSRPAPVPAPSVPRLVIDAYWQESVDWSVLLKARPAGCEYAGALIKATQGTSYFSAALRWFEAGCRAMIGRPTALGDAPFAVLAYHYLEARQSGRAQALYYLRARRRAGMSDSVPGVIDVEKGRDTSSNARATRAQVVATTCEWVETMIEETGVVPILYGGSWLIELKIPFRDLGCSWLWPAAYSATLKRAEYEKLKAKVTDVLAWQYTDGDASYAVTKRGVRLPRVVPGMGARGALDCSVLIPALTDAQSAYDLLMKPRTR